METGESYLEPTHQTTNVMNAPMAMVISIMAAFT